MNSNIIFGIPVTQNQQEFFLSKLTIKQILKFCVFTQRIIIDYDDEGFPIYNNEIQRKVENARVEKIADFLINDPEATFPTNLVLHLPYIAINTQKSVDNVDFINGVEIILNDNVFEEVLKERNISNSGNIYISIIDGQHRIKGIEVAFKRLADEIKNLSSVINSPSFKNDSLVVKLDRFTKRKKDLEEIELVVSFFVEKSLEYQAMIFSTINRTQKRVSEDLVTSLFGLTTEDSPQKTALQVVLALNSHPKSPFYNRIKLYGGKYNSNQSPPLTQSMFVKQIVGLICENSRDAENERLKKRSELEKSSKKDLIFRNRYISNKDNEISDILFYFFKAVESSFLNKDGVSYWTFSSHKDPSNILQTTVGFQSLIEILKDLIYLVEDKYTIEGYREYLIKASDLEFYNQDRYPFTSKSKRLLYLNMSIKIFPPESVNDIRLIELNGFLQ